MDFQTIVYDVNQGVATVTLNRPSAYNAFTEEMNQEITQALKQASRDDDVRCMVITGSGKAFCAGQDLQGVDENTNHATFLRERYHPMLKALKAMPKPVVAAVNGTAAGAGMSLALACDFRLVKPGVKFVSAFMNIGLIPDSGFIYQLPRLVGYAKAMEIAVLGKPITGTEAYELGLATEVFEAETWDESVSKFSEKLAGMPTKAISLVKRYMMDGMHLPYDELLEKEAQAQRLAGLSSDHQEGMQAFKEKRQPQFVGK
ncbi:enoyl-CoA hydratase/isomerase family protein [Tenuibacillus multivorans]|uniref:2-(1,2-epoxy-1,2-dihydrophenyl)acetyl-CoA isomerase n=1 Tax=Tenuibacillus multivorans TaxID=237069 RepID=A0A1H0BVF7_9BACI|nr:enoyl-CoA hydratase-related protein [Tenuibacillus multivorans]GEL77020.1 2-(1,2-epoxy-1,2-dihydrophenyl)acetyl-CoA isomerase [Tenuibacillus multivorans]SDN49577.1 2-(1,2-epoxy-1,2-dihydrophenyl)acetyl-CoA isomerase [Tenuibacillus multivorans]